MLNSHINVFMWEGEGHLGRDFLFQSFFDCLPKGSIFLGCLASNSEELDVVQGANKGIGVGFILSYAGQRVGE